MPDVELERLVWRYEYKQITAEELGYRLRDEARRLGQEFTVYQTQLSILRRWDPKLIKHFEEALSQAYRMFDGRIYQDALRQLRLAGRSLATMELLLQSHADIMTAKTAAAQLCDLANTEHLRQLPTIRSVMQMIELAKHFMSNRQYRQAGFVARFCGKQAAQILRRATVTSKRQRQFDSRLIQIERVCAGTKHLVADDQDRDVAATLNNMRELLATGWLNLIASLVNDWETLLAPRRRFYEAYQGALTSDALTEASAAQQEITTLAQQRQWNAASQRLRQTALAECAERLTLLQTSIQNLTAKWAPPDEPEASAE
jgi:hypothetical protein